MPRTVLEDPLLLLLLLLLRPLARSLARSRSSPAPRRIAWDPGPARRLPCPDAAMVHLLYEARVPRVSLRPDAQQDAQGSVVLQVSLPGAEPGWENRVPPAAGCSGPRRRPTVGAPGLDAGGGLAPGSPECGRSTGTAGPTRGVPNRGLRLASERCKLLRS